MRPRRTFKAPALVYDPEAHREFVTGFRRRKEARRLEAKSKAADAGKEARRQARQEKRDVLRSTVHRVHGFSDDESEADEKEAEVRESVTYGTDDALVTTVVAPMEAPVDVKVRKAPMLRKKSDGEEGSIEKRKGGALLRAVKTVAKVPHGKRRVSYTHSLSKANKRKSQLRTRKLAKK